MPYGEADVVVTLFTERLGRVAALARGARKSGRKLAGALEPMHGLSATLADKPGADLVGLGAASVVRARHRLVADLSRLDAAGKALRWVRAASPPRTPEPEVWAEIVALLDRLDDEAVPAEAAPAELAASGLRLLGAFGWGLELSACVVCGKPCVPDRPSYVDAARGGLVCRACGGGRLVLDAGTRDRLRRAQAGEVEALAPADVAVVIALVDAALAAHGGIDTSR